jgi:arginine decarboxylase-like protein
MEKTYKNCQSCGMPLKQDRVHGGTNIDGSKSTMYCSYCYQNGQFTRDCTVQEMQEFCKNKLIEMKFPKFLAALMVANLPKLARWKKQ